MRNCLLVLGMILVAGFALAAPIDGKWVGEVQGQDGSPMQISYTFKADGATLTGSTKAPGPDAKIPPSRTERSTVTTFHFQSRSIWADRK